MEMERKDSLGSGKHKVKIVFLGDKGVGKSSIITKFAHNRFDENCQATIGVDFMTKMCKFNSSKYKLELWDTAGQEKYRSLIKGYLRGANACVFVYDESNPKTYLTMIDWIKAFEQVAKDDKTFVVLFGNKTDILCDKSELLQAKREGLRQYPKLKEILQLQGSAKLGTNVPQIFQQILEHYEKNSLSFGDLSGRSIGQTLIKTFRVKRTDSQSWSCCTTV